MPEKLKGPLQLAASCLQVDEDRSLLPGKTRLETGAAPQLAHNMP